MKILIVDDDVVSRITLLRFFSDHGNCAVATDGFEGVDLFKGALEGGEPFDLICMDIQMPGLCGIDALARMRDMERTAGIVPGREAKAVMVTCHDDVKNVSASFFQAQATCFVAKPVSFNTLAATLRRENILPS
ncbi:response regulator [Desulfolutivibrio sp.]|uniref:response regulator n=1 Tax=Desulfolutivibrio sp. TaxID=2773296 RepID=UPI002F960D2F